MDGATTMRRTQQTLAGLFTLAAVVGVLPVAAPDVSPATPKQVVAEMEAENRQTAVEDTARILEDFEDAGGRSRGTELPEQRPGAARAGGSEPFTTRLVKRHADWLAPGEPQVVLRWLAQHQESGWEEGWESRYGSPEGRSWTVYLEWKSEVDGLFGKGLLITTARLPGAQTAVRAEAQDIWLLPRSPAARVADTARFKTVSVKRGGQRRALSTSASNPGLVRRVAKLINAQKVVQTEFPLAVDRRHRPGRSQGSFDLRSMRGPVAPCLRRHRRKSLPADRVNRFCWRYPAGKMQRSTVGCASCTTSAA
jgi:hypothetical protein